MGAAKTRLKRMIRLHPTCIFCGGNSATESVDHVPPIIAFTSRYRPRGLEFPACLECNHGSKTNDTALALFSRFDSSEEANPEYLADVEKVMRAVRNNIPGLLEELNTGSRPFGPYGGGILNAGGPIVQKKIREIGAKLGLALHYERTGRIVTAVGGVFTSLTTNFTAIREGLPPEIASYFPLERTLRQGEIHTSEQFTYATQFNDEQFVTAHWVTFRRAFALQIFVVENLEQEALRTFDKSLFVKPGWLKMA